MERAKERFSSQETTTFVSRRPHRFTSIAVGYLRSCPPTLGVGRPRGVRRGSRVATFGRIRVGSWNIGTLTGKRIELVDTFLKSKVDIGCVQETRWRGEGAVDVKDYRLWFSDRIMSVSLIIKEETFTVISAYAPHAGLSDAEKKRAEAEGYEGAHGGFGFGPRNEEGRSILEFSIAHELVVPNSFFKKRDAQLATFYSGGRSTQIDFLLLRKGELRTCKDCMVLPALTCSS
ncbi:uncharacterized protein [Rutidosis leptorrhynchoides]|uniref:uncharacterized protein n=1 Tax=Rutidosis leptorrhynchoides TaxID=125765 RepID=UPI003A99EB81